MKKKTAAIIPIRSAAEALYDAETEKDENIIGKRIAQARKQKGMSIADMQKKSCIDRTYIYQIMDGSKKPGRDKIIAMAVACKMTLPECQRALEIAQEGILYAKSRRDSLIIYAINKKLTIMELNALLEEHGLPVLK